MKEILRSHGMYFAWIIALAATLGSLHYGEAKGVSPCSLCWYQRIAMYPLVFILGIGAYRSDKAATLYALPLSTLGFVFAALHMLNQFHLIQNFGDLCGTGIDCSVINHRLLGLIPLPVASTFSFAAILGLLYCSRPTS